MMADGRKRYETAFLEELRLSYCSLSQVFFSSDIESFA
jgi:hypothetical protein